MSDIENAKQLLALATEDLGAARVLIESGRVPTRIFGFHAQQAVEKALKAWLSLVGVQYPLTHSLNVLFGLLEDKVGENAKQYRDLQVLTPFAVQFRYWGYDDEEEEIDAHEILKKAEDLIEHVRCLVAAA